MRRRFLVLGLLAIGCHRSHGSCLALLASVPMSNDVTVGDGPGIGPELVTGHADATLAGDTLTLAAGKKATLRWSAVPEDLVTITGVTVDTPDVEHSFDVIDGALLVTLKNHGASAAQITPQVSFEIPATIPPWSHVKSFPVLALAEPSGIDFDYHRRMLWVVDDGVAPDSGRLGRVNPETGEVEDSVTLGGDLEAVRWVPRLDVLLLSNETADELWIVDPNTLARVAIAPLVLSSGVLPYTTGGDGFEGLAVTGVHDRTIDFVVANQNDPPALYRGALTLPTNLTGTIPALITSAVAQPPVNLSEVTMDWGSRRLFALHGYVFPNRLVVLDSALNETATEFDPAGLGNEGAAFTPDGALWLSDDLGGITRTAP